MRTTCVDCNSTISKRAKRCPQCGAEVGLRQRLRNAATFREPPPLVPLPAPKPIPPLPTWIKRPLRILGWILAAIAIAIIGSAVYQTTVGKRS